MNKGKELLQYVYSHKFMLAGLGLWNEHGTWGTVDYFHTDSDNWDVMWQLAEIKFGIMDAPKAIEEAQVIQEVLEKRFNMKNVRKIDLNKTFVWDNLTEASHQYLESCRTMILNHLEKA